jgi:hypothetical protein
MHIYAITAPPRGTQGSGGSGGRTRPEQEGLLVLLLSLVDVRLLAGCQPEGEDEAHSQQGAAAARVHCQACYRLLLVR